MQHRDIKYLQVSLARKPKMAFLKKSKNWHNTVNQLRSNNFFKKSDYPKKQSLEEHLNIQIDNLGLIPRDSDVFGLEGAWPFS